ncbi:hypothetical protein GH714_012013 [Hevea brasiliensis]|uniref:Peptidase S8/S53 domain-containing protein n=1 Tax=Hevea brasiliensis TaxID=3981 RepID=A0A6A6N303_HEVBR|nr:hypothetical protein GH714_012013 [Hevea brasiliensis]
MASLKSYISCLLLLCFTSTLLRSGSASLDDRKSYIEYMGQRQNKDQVSISSLHLSMLQKPVEGMEGVVSVFPNEMKKLHTTRSWDFMGFSQQAKRTNLESDIIVGMIDTGIWPESQSFNDEGFGPPPAKWKGSCHVSSNFSCNNKIIGATFYRSNGLFGAKDLKSPRDSQGHGTHTASTAAGGVVNMASLYGLGIGTARGGVPSARIAVYKVCWSDGCWDADILAAFDDAIADGVDIISVSLGGSTPLNYFKDLTAIGAFHAMKHRILTLNSAGNYGPVLRTITNFSPWSLSVAASTIDRKFISKVRLGNNRTYEGISINTFDLNNTMLPIIYRENAPNTKGNFTGSRPRLLDSSLVKGKIVYDELDSGVSAFLAGAAGIVTQYHGAKDVAESFPLPASCLGHDEGSSILSYINSTGIASATIYKSNQAKNSLAPYVVAFSSRGPNPITRDILKPDISPGVDILASWSLLRSVTEIPEDNRRVPYNIISGTSMACPHATGAAAYVKSYHPTWSPAALKSALMTTSFPMNSKINSEAEFAYGAGHINPAKAINPGLIYDAEPIDYIKFLCGQGHNSSLLQMVTGDNSSCSTNGTVWDLNYPSFALSISPSEFISRVYNRIVTNIGSPTSTYKATMTSHMDLKSK